MADFDGALTLANDLLERTGTAMETGDFTEFRSCFAFPFLIETFEHKRILNTERELQTVFEDVRQFRSKNRVTHLVRENVAAQLIDHETISATHVSRMVQEGGILFGRPYPTYSIIKRLGRRWRITFAQYAIDAPDGLNEALTPSNTPTPR